MALLIGTTIEYFVDKEDSRNVFAAGKIDISLTEHELMYNESGRTLGSKVVYGNDYYDVYPGLMLPKDPTITNHGDQNAYVLLSIKIPLTEYRMLTTNHDISELFVGLDNTKWNLRITQADIKSNKLKLEYNGILEPGESVKVFDGIIIPEDINITKTNPRCDIVLSAYAVQTKGFAKDNAMFNENERDEAFLKAFGEL